jgi:hypothetical protein
MRKSLLLKYIEQNSNWEPLLSEPPYSLEIFREDDLALFKYRMGFSDMSLDIVREARGIIVDTKQMKIAGRSTSFSTFKSYSRRRLTGLPPA